MARPGGNPLWVKGVSGNPKGKLKGTKSRKSLLTEKIVAETRAGKQTPMEYLLDVMNDVKSSKRERMEAAGMLLPYVHQRQPQAISASVEKPETLVAMIQSTLRAVTATSDAPAMQEEAVSPARPTSGRPRLQEPTQEDTDHGLE